MRSIQRSGLAMVTSHQVGCSASQAFSRASCDAVTTALLEQEQCTREVQDSAVSADRGGRVMEIEVTVQASSEHEAIAIGQAAIRSAIHAAGLSTVWWPSHDEVVSLLPTDCRPRV